MSEQTILSLTESEKKELLDSIGHLIGKLDSLVKTFYEMFLKTSSGALFQNTNMERQFMMFNSSISIIISHIENPLMLKDHLDYTIKKHLHYGVKADQVDDFIASFYEALKINFPGDLDKHRVEMWYKLINSVMLYFKNQLH